MLGGRIGVGVGTASCKSRIMAIVRGSIERHSRHG